MRNKRKKYDHVEVVNSIDNQDYHFTMAMVETSQNIVKKPVVIYGSLFSEPEYAYPEHGYEIRLESKNKKNNRNEKAKKF